MNETRDNGAGGTGADPEVPLARANTPKPDKNARRKSALKANMARRKAQAAARKDTSVGDTPADTNKD